MPFLRLTRDRRGFEHTFLLHADAPGLPPRVLYWYRTAPGVLIGRPALDEEAIRAIEEQHPHIEFDWPAILALREAMPPEEEAEAPPPRSRRPSRREAARPPRTQERPPVAEVVVEDAAIVDTGSLAPEPIAPSTRGLLEELVGREIATRLRARYAEIMARIHEQGFDESALAAWVARAEPLDPDTWLTPDAVLEGVRDADARFEQLRATILGGK
ncbi:MAG TPA: hypothetical protein VL263_22670 [Vicinamibacterales bacterium]|nr:hypothetical protein [Vicinamibacterales bacterium]